MTFDRKHLLLYAVTDRSWTGEKTLREQVESALKGGVTCVQLRKKKSKILPLFLRKPKRSAPCAGVLKSLF